MAQQGNSLVAELVNEMQQPNPGMGGGGYMQQPMGMQPQGMPMQPGMPMQGGMPPQGMPMQPGMGGGMPDPRMMMQQGGVAPVPGGPGGPPPGPGSPYGPGGPPQMPPQGMQGMQGGPGGPQYEDEEEMPDEYEDEMPVPRGMVPQGQYGPGQPGPMMDMTQFGMEDPNKSWVDTIMEGFKDPLIIAVLFMILSVPQVNRVLIQTLPVVGNNLYYNLGFKALVMATLFFAIKYLLG